MSIQVTFGGTGVTDNILLRTVSVRKNLNRRDTASLTAFSDAANLIASVPVRGTQVGIYNVTGAQVFGGIIDQVMQTPQSVATDSLTHYECLCIGWEYRINRRYVWPSITYGQVFVADAATDTLTSHGHNLSDTLPVRLETTGTLPAGLSTGTTYYVRDAAANTFKLAATAGGAAINITTAGSGTHAFQWQAGEIVKHVLATYCSSELIGIYTNVAGGVFVSKRIYDCAPVTEVIDELAQVSNYIWWVDEGLLIHFQARTITTAPWDIIATSPEIFRGIHIRTTGEDKRNREYIRCAWQAFGTTEESFVGDGVATQWWLAAPAALIESMTIGGEARTFGVDGADAGLDFYWAPGERTIRQDSAGTVLTATETLVVNYRELGTNIIEEEDAASIAAAAIVEGGTGVWSHLTDDSANVSANAAQATAQSLVATYKDDARELNYTTIRDGIVPGQVQQITLPAFGVASPTAYLIDSVEFSEWGDQATFLYRVKALAGNRVIDGVEWFQSLVEGGGGETISVGAFGSASTDGTIAYA